MLRVNLCESEYLAIGERPPVLLFYGVQVRHLLGREGQSLLLIVLLQILHMLNRLRLTVHSEQILVQSLVHTLQHRVVRGLLGAYWEVFLDTRDASQIHVLGNLYGIRTPWCHHLTARPHIDSIKLFCVYTFCSTKKPAQFAGFFLRRLMVYLGGNNGFLRGFKEENHISLLLVWRIFGIAKRVRAERNQACLKLLRRSLFYAKIAQAESKENLLALLRRSLSYAKIAQAESKENLLALLRRSLSYAKILQTKLVTK